MKQTFWYAFWLMTDERTGKVLKCIRGPKDNLPELNDEVRRMWSGHFEIIELPYRDPQRAKGIIADKLAQSEGLGNALGKTNWKIPKNAEAPLPR